VSSFIILKYNEAVEKPKKPVEPPASYDYYL
jgi:hypothetical protein